MRYVLLFLISLSAGYAQDFVWTPGLQSAYADLQKLKIQSAKQRMARESARDGVRIFLDDYADMLLLVTSDDDRLFAAKSEQESTRLDALKKLSDTSPWQRVLIAEVRLHWAFVKLKFGKELSASWDVIRAYKLLSENQKRFPDFLPTYKSLGTLHIMIGSVPESYVWVAKLLGMQGTIRQGQQELQRAQHDPNVGLEAQLIDLMVRAYVLKFSDTDRQTLARLVSQNPDNLLLHFFGATIEQKNGRGEQALTYLLNRPADKNYQPLPVVENILGDIYLQKGEYERASLHFNQFLHAYRGQNFLKDTYYKLFLCHWLASPQNTRSSDTIARNLLQKVLSVGRTTVESDKVAQKFAESSLKNAPASGQKILMQARLASDGGFTDQALTYLRPYSEASFSTTAERAEYNYRMGRIYQRRENPDSAISYLARALTLSETDQLSFGATAALQLGYIYQQKNDRARAQSFFQKALTFRHHEYKNSVDNKAKAGISSL
ncbi:tetratricopeptide repeat protein [Spirosoma spitsbergense]|uniref:tetratricopeptide repeat protein n=1 Tax=Spirosoma spitsbergense TaxID=431554 RepID=UPI000380E367|nr:tetratricopeptide repeat protein [Spirosoma spitsbergense]